MRTDVVGLNPLSTYKLLACLLGLMVVCSAKAQLFQNRGTMQGNGLNTTADSNRKKQIKTNDSIKIYQFTYGDTTRAALDTGIATLHHNPIQSVWMQDLGNFASASQPLFFQPSFSVQHQLGMYADSSYRFQPGRTPYYNTTRPYSELYYRLGSKQEQIIQIQHSRNINPYWNVTAIYRKEGSAGAYKLQRTNNDHVAISTNYFPKGQRFFLQGELTYNKIQQDENGGILSYEYLYASNYNNKRLVPVQFDERSGEKNRSTVMNYHRDLNGMLRQQYFFGRSEQRWNVDSSAKERYFYPRVGLQLEAYTTSEIYRFKDLSPDSLYYLPAGSYSFTYNDSMYTRNLFRRWGATLAIIGDLRLKQQVAQTEAGYGMEYDRYATQSGSMGGLNPFVYARLRKKGLADAIWMYQGDLRFYLAGSLAGATQASLFAGRRLGAEGSVRIGAEQSVQQAPLRYSLYSSSFFTWQQSFRHSLLTRISLQYLNKATRSSVTLYHTLLTRYVYLDTTWHPQQDSHVISLEQAHIQQGLHWRYWISEQDVLLQYSAAKGPLQLPLLAVISRWGYERALFKRRLLSAIGMEWRYHTPYEAGAYAPLLFSYVTQTTEKIRNFPRPSLYVNFRVKTFRASVSFEELQQLFTRNTILYPGYAAPNFLIHFGFHWMFVN